MLEEIRKNFQFSRFYGYCEGILMYKNAITLEDFKTGFNYALECTVKELSETKQLEEVNMFYWKFQLFNII